MSTLRDRHLLVVGATGGLGAPLCRALASEGARLTLGGRDPDRLAALAGELGDAVLGSVAGDLTDPAFPDALAAAVGDGLHGVVLASGVVAFGPLTGLDDDDLDQLFLVNLIGPIRVLRTLLPRLGDGGLVVTLSAVVAEKPMPGMAAYSATKAALTALDAALATELRRSGVRVLDVRPPHTETGLATRPLAGRAPQLPQGKDPDAVAARIVRAVLDDERELPSTAF